MPGKTAQDAVEAFLEPLREAVKVLWIVAVATVLAIVGLMGSCADSQPLAQDAVPDVVDLDREPVGFAYAIERSPAGGEPADTVDPVRLLIGG